jgi:hypothetical protein
VKPRVYVVQQSIGKDVHIAEQYGDVFIMLRHDETVGGKYGRILDKLEKLLADFRCDKDYLLPCGDPVAYGIAISIVSSYDEPFRILRWNSAHNKYVPVKVDLND